MQRDVVLTNILLFLGHLFSVSPSAMRSIEGLFNFNERVLLYGHWRHGKFLMAAIGAYNVGSIQLPFAVEKVFCLPTCIETARHTRFRA